MGNPLKMSCDLVYVNKYIVIIIANNYTPIAHHACNDAHPVHEVMDVIIIVTVKAADNAESINKLEL